jgi:hypothetical protein
VKALESMLTTNEVLAEIFSADTGYGQTDADVLASCPNYSKLAAFAAVLAVDPKEEALQQFIEAHPELLMGLFGWGDDSVLAFLTKPSVGTKFRADFGVLQYGQGGCCVHLVELEPSNEHLFTKSGNRAQRHNSALTQVRDWNAWIQPNKATFVRDLFETIRELPLFPELSLNGSFRRRDYDSIERSWRGFGGFEDPLIDCTIVIGRWSKMTHAERSHLLTQNRHDNKLARVITYEQLARSAFERPFRNW